MEGASGDDRSEAACVHRRDLGENQHDPHPWSMRQRRTPRRCAPFPGDGEPSRSWRRCVATGSTAPCVIDGPINGASFRAYASSRFSSRSSRQATLSSWTTSEVSKGRAVRAPPSARPKPSSCSCPPTRQTFNPIEQAFAKIKTLLRKADARTIEQTWRTIGSLLDCFHPDRMRKLLHQRRICFGPSRSRPSRKRRSTPNAFMRTGARVSPSWPGENPPRATDTLKQRTDHLALDQPPCRRGGPYVFRAVGFRG